MSTKPTVTLSEETRDGVKFIRFSAEGPLTELLVRHLELTAEEYREELEELVKCHMPSPEPN